MVVVFSYLSIYIYVTVKVRDFVEVLELRTKPHP